MLSFRYSSVIPTPVIISQSCLQHHNIIQGIIIPVPFLISLPFTMT